MSAVSKESSGLVNAHTHTHTQITNEPVNDPTTEQRNGPMDPGAMRCGQEVVAPASLLILSPRSQVLFISLSGAPSAVTSNETGTLCHLIRKRTFLKQGFLVAEAIKQ